MRRILNILRLPSAVHSWFPLYMIARYKEYTNKNLLLNADIIIFGILTTLQCTRNVSSSIMRRFFIKLIYN